MAPRVFIGRSFRLLCFIRCRSITVFCEVQAYITGTDIGFAADIDSSSTTSGQLSILDGIINSTTCYQVTIAGLNLTCLDIDSIGCGIAILFRADSRMCAVDDFDGFFSQITDDGFAAIRNVIHSDISLIQHSRIHRSAGDQLIIALSNSTRTQRLAPSRFIGCLCFRRSICHNRQSCR